MAIKVKHEGNVTSRITAAAAGGRGKRSADDGKAWMQIAAQEAMAGNRQLQGAHASPVSTGHATAQLINAPTGSAPGIIHAPSGGVGGRGGGRGVQPGASAATGESDYKVTGTSIFNRPDKESQWDPNKNQWIRKWLPGEKEAEAAQRMNPVLAEREEFQQGLRNDAAVAAGEREMAMLREKAGLAEEAAEAKMAREAELFDYKLTQKQRMEIAAINDAVENARKSGDWLPNELANLRRQADMLRLGIKPQAVPRGISPQRTVDENMVNIDGRRYFYTPNGDLKELDPRPSFKDFVSAFQSMRNVNTTRPGPGGVGTESVKETLSPEDTAAVVRSAADMYQKMFGVNPSAGQATQPSPAPVPAPQPAPQAPAAQPAPQESDEDFLKRLRGE